MPGAWLEELAWPEVAARMARGTPILVPVGAAAKEHGPHLPMNTDWLIARALAERVAAALPVLVAPIVGHGHYPAFVRYPGSQSLGAATMIDVMVDLLDRLIAQGATRLAILNTGVSTEAPIALAARTIWEKHGVRVGTAHLRELGQAAASLLTNPGGGHGDERETSIMLAIAPERVRLDRLTAAPPARPPVRTFRVPVELSPDTNPEGYLGDPRPASAATGRALMDAIVHELVAGLRELFPDAF
jgi:creatinine amidohydrolase